jgi:hypothetical protein
MLEVLKKEEVETYLQENPTLVSLYEIDVVKEVGPYQQLADTDATIVELERGREALECELAVSSTSSASRTQGVKFGNNKGAAQCPSG